MNLLSGLEAGGRDGNTMGSFTIRSEFKEMSAGLLGE